MTSISGGPPVETIIIARADDRQSCAGTVVMKIPPTVAEHNMILHVLKELRHRYPGAWYCAKEWERQEYPTRIGVVDPTVPPAVKAPSINGLATGIVDKVKGISAVSMGIEGEGLGDVPL